MTTEKHSWKQTPLLPNLTNRCCKQGTHQQTTFTDPQTCCYNQVQQQLDPLYSDYNPAISWNSFRRCRTAAHLTGKKSEACVLVDRASSPDLSAYLSITQWKFWNCAENMATRQERGERKKGKPRERRVRSEHAWKASKAAREDLWEPRIFTLGTRLLCCSERLLPEDWSHPPGSLRPLSPPPLQTLVCDYLLRPPSHSVHEIHSHTHMHFVSLKIIVHTVQNHKITPRVCLQINTILVNETRDKNWGIEKSNSKLQCKHECTFLEISTNLAKI